MTPATLESIHFVGYLLMLVISFYLGLRAKSLGEALCAVILLDTCIYLISLKP